jgi:anaerobic dimethyl sulfoxide reductase subunit C
MNSNEWPLVFFTLFSQMATGLVAGFVILRAVRQSAISDGAERNIILTAFFLMTIALLISFFHLGSPAKAVYAMSNLGSSWLSREILAVSVFWGLLLFWFLVLKFPDMLRQASPIIPWVCALAGIVMVYTMARLYMIPTVPPWNSLFTISYFYSSSVLLGVPLLMFILIKNDQYFSLRIQEQSDGTDLPVRYVFAVLIGLAFLLFILRSGYNLITDPVSNMPVFAPEVFSPWLKVLQFLLPGSAVSMFIVVLITSVIKKLKYKSNLVLVAFTFLMISEIIGRYMFYAGYYRLGV